MPDQPHRDEIRRLTALLGPAMVELRPESIYPWAPVFRARVIDDSGAEVDAVLKRTWSDPRKVAALNRWQHTLISSGVPAVCPLSLRQVTLPVRIGEENFTAYPWVEGSHWNAGLAHIAMAGRLLGMIHTASQGGSAEWFPSLDWPAADAASVAEDVEAIRQVCAAEAGEPELSGRWAAELSAFADTTLPAIRDAQLPSYPVSLDHRAVNLIYPPTAALPTMVDFENGQLAPRILDLAGSVLLFPSEAPGSPGRLFNAEEWSAFRDAYLATAPELTSQETRLWVTALGYMKLEWGTWHLTEGAEWDFPGERGVLRDLLTVDVTRRFPLV